MMPVEHVVMVPTEHVVIAIAMLVVSVLLPWVVWFIVWRRTKASIVNLLVGAAVFFVCYLIAIATSLVATMFIASPIILTLVLALRAGLVEEFGRFIAFKFFLKKRKNVSDAFMYGVGHGGMEVYLAFTIAMFSQIILFMAANAGTLDALYAAAPAQGEMIKESLRALAQSNPWILSLGLIERIVAMALHIALSVIVFCAVRQRKWLYLVLAIALHALVNSGIALYVGGMVNAWQIEALLALATVGVALIAWRIAVKYKNALAAPDAAIIDTATADTKTGD